MFKLDCHVHFLAREGLDAFIGDAVNQLEREGADAITLLAIRGLCARFDSQPDYISALPDDMYALYLAATDRRFYAYSGFSYRPNLIPFDSEGLAEQAQDLISAGFNGIKFIEGKPVARKATGIPLDDERYDKAFDIFEKSGIHLLYHVNDPEEFWDAEKCPDWANEGSGGYYAGGYLTKQQHYDEIERLMERHPNLNITFAHAFFLSNFPDEMVRWLEKFPRMSFDLTPGIEMYDGFSKNREKWREIFIKYQDRIVFGTDCFVRPAEAGDPLFWVGADSFKVDTIVRFLTTADDFSAWDYELHGLFLPEEVVEKIMHKNIIRLMGERPFNKENALAYCRKVLAAAENSPEVLEREREGIREVISRFEAL